MRKLGVWLGVGLTIAAFTADLPGQTKRAFPQRSLPQGDLIVQSINIVLPSGGDCTVRWSATIKNKGVEFRKDKSIKVQAYQVSSDGHTKPAGDRPLGPLGPGETITTEPVPFSRWGYVSRLRVVLSGSAGLIAERTVEFPPEPIAHSFTLENFHLNESATGYELTLKNPLPTGFCDITFQTFASKKDPPPADNAWLGAGGEVIPCLAGQSQYVRAHSLERGTKYLKIEIYRRGTRIMREVYDLRGMMPPISIENQTSHITELAPIAQIGIKAPSDLTVQDIDVVLPSGTGCTLQWSATIARIKKRALELQTDKSITAQAYQVSSDGHTKPAGNLSLKTDMAPGETVTTQLVPFNRWGYATLFKVVLTSSRGVLAESTIALPPEPIAHSFSLQDFHLINSGSGYEVTLKNPLPTGFCDITFQTFASKKDPPPADKAWLGAGGELIPCLAGQNQYVRTHSLEAGTLYLKIEIYRMGSRIMRKVYDLRGPTPVEATDK
jgi:hypothetical protein